jgi:hypothetical protein
MQAPSSSRAGWGNSEGRHKPLLGGQTSRCCRAAVQFWRWILFGENSCAIIVVCLYRGVLTTRWFLYVWESWVCQTQALSSSRAGWGDSEGRHKPLLGGQTSKSCRAAVQFRRWLLFGENSCAIIVVCLYRGVLMTRWFLYVWEPWVLDEGCGSIATKKTLHSNTI